MKLLRISTVLSCSFSLAAIVACGGREQSAGAGSASDAARNAKPLTVKGSDTMVILGQRFAEEYMKQNAGTVVQVTGGGSGTGIAALINGTVDLAQSSRPMKGDEKADAEKRKGAPIVETPVALDALAVFVNASNPVKELTVEQLKSIYQGKVTNWNQIGGGNATIILYGRENNSGTYDYFREHVLAKEDFTPKVQTLAGTAAVVNAVSKDINGIGYGGIAYESNVRPLAVREGAGAAVIPSEATVADGSYYLSRKLFFYYASNAPERVKAFADWATTPEGQKVVVDVGYFPLNKAGAAVNDSTATTTDPSLATTSSSSSQ